MQIDYDKLSEFYKVFGDTTRLMILNSLLNGSKCVSGIALSLNKSHSLISHQLKYLKDLNLVKCLKEGQTAIYSISDEHIKVILKYGLEHINEGR
ncbi:MAG: metalloregulator ArsR/SmtB family transcription factor [Tenericutes bacterium]|nr:metalloregulator ArsR/SmtB family transcription factor [Mycoplasmatota bacterium]